MEDDCSKIINIDRATGLIQVDKVPKHFAGVEKFDFIQDENPNKILKVDVAKVDLSINTRAIQVNPSDIPDRLKVGDWVCEYGTSPYPNVPMELHPVLAQRATIAILEALGDNESLNKAQEKLRRIEKSVQKTLDN